MLMLDEDTLVFQRRDFACSFSQFVVLGEQEADIFNEPGERFSAPKGRRPSQQARSVTFQWKSYTLALLDVGYAKFVRKEGKCHLVHDAMIKWMLAEDQKGQLFFLENLKSGTDRIWIQGTNLGTSIAPYVGKITRAVA